jgi:hypothetical protein
VRREFVRGGGPRSTNGNLRESRGSLVVNSLSRFVQPVAIDLRSFWGYRPVEMIGEGSFSLIGELPYFLTMAARSFIWFRLDPPERLFNRAGPSTARRRQTG